MTLYVIRDICTLYMTLYVIMVMCTFAYFNWSYLFQGQIPQLGQHDIDECSLPNQN